MLAQAHVAALAGRHLPAGLVVAGSVLMAAATVEGAWLALRRPGRHGAWLGAASGALLVIALLAGQSRRRVGGWLAALCLSLAAGAAAISAYRLPSAAGPVLLALAAGVLAQAARISLRAASRTPAGRRLAPGAAAALLAAAAVTAVAVRVAG